jgi:hypothetical protein
MIQIVYSPPLPRPVLPDGGIGAAPYPDIGAPPLSELFDGGVNIVGSRCMPGAVPLLDIDGTRVDARGLDTEGCDMPPD